MWSEEIRFKMVHILRGFFTEADWVGGDRLFCQICAFFKNKFPIKLDVQGSDLLSSNSKQSKPLTPVCTMQFLEDF